MKNIITIVIVLIIGSAIGYLAMSHYNNYQQNRESATASEQAAKDQEATNQIKTLTTERDGAKQQTEALRAECMKGLEAYNGLTAFNKTRFEAPVCEEAVPATE